MLSNLSAVRVKKNLRDKIFGFCLTPILASNFFIFIYLMVSTDVCLMKVVSCGCPKVDDASLSLLVFGMWLA